MDPAEAPAQATLMQAGNIYVLIYTLTSLAWGFSQRPCAEALLTG